MDTRRCYRCKQQVPFPDGFPRDSSRSTGRMAICRPCDNERARERYATIRGPKLRAARLTAKLRAAREARP